MNYKTSPTVQTVGDEKSDTKQSPWFKPWALFCDGLCSLVKIVLKKEILWHNK
jgi:hypothetical protein